MDGQRVLRCPRSLTKSLWRPRRRIGDGKVISSRSKTRGWFWGSVTLTVRKHNETSTDNRSKRRQESRDGHSSLNIDFSVNRKQLEDEIRTTKRIICCVISKRRRYFQIFLSQVPLKDESKKFHHEKKGKYTPWREFFAPFYHMFVRNRRRPP